MSTPWPLAPLGEVLTLSNNSVPSVQLSSINLAGVYSFGRGLFKRGPILPTETTYQSFNRLVTDEFVISQPKAWEGAIARITEEFNGWYLSPVFPTFRVDKQKLEPRFLEWFCRREPVWCELQQKSRGIGARRESVSPAQFLSIHIPLPSLPEQRRIVARIEELAAKIEEARALRHNAADETEALVAARRARLMNQMRRFDQLEFDTVIDQLRGGSGLPRKEYQISGRFPVVDQGQQFIGGYCDDENQLLRISEPVVVWGDHTTNVKLVDFNFVPGADGTKVFLPKRGMTAPFLCHFLKSVDFPDLGYSRYYRYLKEVLIPVPPIVEQGEIVAEMDALQAEVDTLKRQQAETTAELNALLPAVLDRAFKGELFEE